MNIFALDLEVQCVIFVQILLLWAGGSEVGDISRIELRRVEISPYERLSRSMACCICLLKLWHSGVEKSLTTCKQSRSW